MWVPDEGSEALRDLVRAREAAKQDQTRARHRLSKFLLRSGQRPPTGVRPWTLPYLIWVAQLRFTHIGARVHAPGLSARGRGQDWHKPEKSVTAMRYRSNDLLN